MNRKKGLTRFAKDCAYAHEIMVKLMCISEEIAREDIAKELNNDNQDALTEVARLFSKYAKENMYIDVDNGDIQNVQNIINSIIDCCEEHNWFE